MAEFYGEVRGKAITTATRTGSKNSGIRAEISTWQSILKTRMFCTEESVDGHNAFFELTDKHGNSTGLYFYFDADAIAGLSDRPEALGYEIKRVVDAMAALNTKARRMLKAKRSEAPIG